MNQHKLVNFNVISMYFDLNVETKLKQTLVTRNLLYSEEIYSKTNKTKNMLTAFIG